MMRIGIGGLSCECSTFSPLATREEDFRVLSGVDLLAQYDFPADFPETEFIPLSRARALPGGRIRRRFFDDFLDDLVRKISNQEPFDGIFLQMHGAASVYGLEDAEGHIIAAIREAAGPECLISASYDLHGNLSQRVIDHLDLLTAHRTAPHEDWYETVARAVLLLVQCLRNSERPATSFIKVPMLLPGEQTSTDWEPAAGLYREIPRVIEQFGLLDASILVGYVWADEPRAAASVVALGPDPERTRDAAEILARRFWDLRREFRFGGFSGTVEACLERATAGPGTPVLISDSGDNPTAGGAGDIPYALGRMLEFGVDNALCAAIADRGAVAICEHAGSGAGISLELGGKLDPLNGTPLRVTGRVVGLHDTVLPESGRSNRVALLQCAGVTVIITEQRTPFHHRRQFTELGLVPEQFKIVMVKIGYLVPELQAMAAESLLALTPGVVNQEITSLPYRRLNRPIFPLDPEMDWLAPRNDRWQEMIRDNA